MITRRLQQISQASAIPKELVLDSYLKVWYDASDPSSYPGTGTVLYDKSGNGNNGTLFNGTAWSDNAMNFDGSNDYIASISNVPISGAAARTMSCWFKMNSVTAANKSVMNIGAGPDGKLFELLVSGSSTLTAHFYGTGYAIGTTVPENLSAQWNNAAIVYDGYVVYLYYNGVLRAQLTKALNTTAAKFRFGIPSGSQSYNNSKVRQAMLYSRALSGAEVFQNFNALRESYEV